jgi:hypothetical protein
VKAAEQRKREHITCWKLCRELLFLFFCLFLPSWHEGKSYDVRLSWTIELDIQNSESPLSRHSGFVFEYMDADTHSFSCN